MRVPKPTAAIDGDPTLPRERRRKNGRRVLGKGEVPSLVAQGCWLGSPRVVCTLYLDSMIECIGDSGFRIEDDCDVEESRLVRWQRGTFDGLHVERAEVV